jgi:hypothetical protein
LVLSFEHTHGSNGEPANRLLLRLAGLAERDRYSEAAVRASGRVAECAAFVERAGTALFEELRRPAMRPEPLDSGAECLVFDCRNGYILKIRPGPASPLKPYPHLLQPASAVHSSALDLTVEFYPKATKYYPGRWYLYGLVVDCWRRGYSLSDVSRENFGLVTPPDGGAARPVIIDYGVVRPVRFPRDFTRMRRDFIYVLHELHPWLRGGIDRVRSWLEKIRAR